MQLLLSGRLDAQDKYVTISLPYSTFESNKTNSLTIRDGEVAELVSHLPAAESVGATGSGFPGFIYVKKGDVVAFSYPALVPNGGGKYSYGTDKVVAVGPCTVSLVASRGAAATFKILPIQYPPDKTAVVPGGPGGARVRLEESTNLVNWTITVGGTYTNQSHATFFRIRMDRLEP